jgi:hypothetical protein
MHALLWLATFCLAAMHDVNLLDGPGRGSPLSRAIQLGHKRLVAALIERGADPLATDRQGNLLLNNALETFSASPPALQNNMVEGLRPALEHISKWGQTIVRLVSRTAAGDERGERNPPADRPGLRTNDERAIVSRPAALHAVEEGGHA